MPSCSVKSLVEIFIYLAIPLHIMEQGATSKEIAVLAESVKALKTIDDFLYMANYCDCRERMHEISEGGRRFHVGDNLYSEEEEKDKYAIIHDGAVKIFEECGEAKKYVLRHSLGLKRKKIYHISRKDYRISCVQ